MSTSHRIIPAGPWTASQRLGPAALLLLAAAALAACPGDGRRDIVVDGVERSYFVFTPSTYDGVTPMPVLLAFHGAFRSASAFRNDVSMDAAAERAGFIVVYPQAVGTVWHPVDEVPGAMDDVKFVAQLLDEVEREFAVDPDHIYATGLSLGGLLTYRLATTFPHRIAGIAPVAAGGMPAELQEACKALNELPFLAIHGDADGMLPWEGRPGHPIVRAAFPLVPVEETLAVFADNLGCWDELVRSELADYDPHDGTTTSMLEYIDCSGAATVSLLRVHGGGHTWPGSNREQPIRSGPTSQDYEASEIVVDFFAQFVRRSE